MIMRRTVLCVALLVLIFSFFSCKSTPEVSVSPTVVEVEPTVSTDNLEQQAIQLAVPVIPSKPEKLGNFPDINAETLKLIENGNLHIFAK